ncbi:lipopolysaccharide heptosyltransferase I [Gilvimarinus polysaccharolyticus]|uniref:lipopolysaccharide heptosyltransferase I n=1 Tax=Gilvimarinus polysaccharolyticus TaxID=863921 RepID=UPI0018DB1CDC|nr:lipopolysaccharide heptosyltransferase I [Gilvimarinus polysaccharolyticus]
MRVLLVKLSSMGDLVQTLPAISDAVRAIPGIEFDWVVDEAFADVPSWHPAVKRVIRSAHRRWKRNLRQSWRAGELKAFWRELRAEPYDLVLDAQTSIKSAVVTRMARGPKVGPDKHSVREYGAHWAYGRQVPVSQDIHAIDRWRLLFARGLGYELPNTPPDFGLTQAVWPALTVTARPYLIAVTNASWQTKCLPDNVWRELIVKAAGQGLDVLLPWGAPAERERAEQIAAGLDNAIVLPRLALTELAGLLNRAEGALCNDTGLAHIAAALGRPCVTAYGPTDPNLIAATGPRSVHLAAQGTPDFTCAPCYKRECHYREYRGPQAQCLQAMSADALWQLLIAQRPIK